MLERVPNHEARVGVSMAFRRLYVLDANNEPMLFPQEIIELIAHHTDALYKRCRLCTQLFTYDGYKHHTLIPHITMFPFGTERPAGADEGVCYPGSGIDPMVMHDELRFGMSMKKKRYSLAEARRKLNALKEDVNFNALYPSIMKKHLLPPPAPRPPQPKSIQDCDACGRAIPFDKGRGGVSSAAGTFCNRRCARGGNRLKNKKC